MLAYSIEDSDDVTLWGDANLDGEVDINDVVYLNKTVLGKDDTISEQGFKNCDIDQNKHLTATDALNVMKLVVKLITQDACPITEE